MLTLSLLRHAKSSWNNPSLADRDRPLAIRGVADAPLMGRAMTERGIDPDLVLCSSARRTRDTLALVLPELKVEPQGRLRGCALSCERSRDARDVAGRAAEREPSDAGGP